jgi:hypothetical protein
MGNGWNQSQMKTTHVRNYSTKFHVHIIHHAHSMHKIRQTSSKEALSLQTELLHSNPHQHNPKNSQTIYT